MYLQRKHVRSAEAEGTGILVMVGKAATVEGEGALATKEYGFFSKDLWTRIVARAKTWDVKRQVLLPRETRNSFIMVWERSCTDTVSDHSHNSGLCLKHEWCPLNPEQQSDSV